MARREDLLHLLLARAGERAPAWPDGMPLGAFVPPAPEARADDMPPEVPHAAPEREGVEPDPDDFKDNAPPLPPPVRELWGVIAPEGAAGDRLLDLIEPLMRWRARQQGERPPVHRVPKIDRPWGPAEAIAWRKERYDGGSDLGRDRATTQLILGDLSEVPLALQQLQSIDGRVGRIVFDDDAGYAAYVAKVIAAERAPAARAGRVLFHTAHDGSAALDAGSAGLATPGEAALRAEIAKKGIEAAAFLSQGERGVTAMDALLANAADPAPGVLFSLSHGAGAPRDGWASREAQRAGQGAMYFGFEGQLSGRDLANAAFMPSGLWLMFACFGAGTPDTSAYATWLARLEASGRGSPDVLRSLAIGAPFIADLPKRALASPKGPLAFVGHVDLAWTFSFRDVDAPDKSRAGRLVRVLASALAGETFGFAFHELSRFVGDTDAELMQIYAGDKRAGDDAELRRALLWMARQDLAGFILLGDPGARLPIDAPRRDDPMLGDTDDATAPRAADSIAPGAVPGPAEIALALSIVEPAIGALLSTNRSVDEVAAEHGLPRADLAEAFERYRAAGRRALGLGGR